MIVYVRLKTNDIFSVDNRLAEVREMKEWLDELVEWDKSKYSLTFHSSGARLVIWFEEDEHAIMCKLRWS